MNGPAAELLAQAASDGRVGIWSADGLRRAGAAAVEDCPAVLVYGLVDDRSHRDLLQQITGMAVIPREAKGDAAILTWTAEARQLAVELPGMELSLDAVVLQGTTFDLEPGGAARTEILACLNGRPWLVRIRAEARWIYLLGIRECPQAGTIVTSAAQELPLVSASIALLVFVRTHFANDAWFAPVPSANFIIDDPLLREAYGFLRHRQLADRVGRAGAAATIAFIPWNAHRSDPATVSLYRNSPHLSICVHGYEHTRREFATRDETELRWRSDAALVAMRNHEIRTGLSFEPVMVFPQGCFVSSALDALADAGFLAAANSTFLEADRGSIVRLQDLLEPAVTAYGPMPLFRRRGPDFVSRCRYDAVLGRPLLLVAHHEYFEDGGAALEALFGSLARIAPSTEWRTLGDIARRTHLVRRGSPGTTKVHFYCRQFRYRATQPGLYELSKREKAPTAVTINGRKTEFTVDGDWLRVRFEVGRCDQEIAVEVHATRPPARSKTRRGPSALLVAARRYLAEGRDNYITTRPYLRSCMTTARQVMRRTS